MKKNSKIFLSLLIVLVMSLSAVALVACGPKVNDPVANQVEGASVEQFAFAVAKKNEVLLNKVNAFFALDSTTANIGVSMDFHSGASDTTILYPNLKDNTGGVITMVTEAGFAPYEYANNTSAGSVGGVAGVDVDLMILFAEENNYTLKVAKGTFDAVIPTVMKDKMTIAAAGLTINEERKEKVDFATPYVESIQYIISSKSTGNYTKMSELAGLNVGVQTGATGHLNMEAAVDEANEDNDFTAGILYNTNTVISNNARIMNVYQDFKNGKIDAIIIDKFVALNLIKN